MTLEDWNLFDSVPAWREATIGTTEERKMKLRRPETRGSMREEYDKGGMETLAFIFGELPKWIARKVHRADLKNKYEGLSIEQIAEREHKHVIDAMLDRRSKTTCAPSGRHQPGTPAPIYTAKC
jgi:hypothetical protein